MEPRTADQVYANVWVNNTETFIRGNLIRVPAPNNNWPMAFPGDGSDGKGKNIWPNAISLEKTVNGFTLYRNDLRSDANSTQYQGYGFIQTNGYNNKLVGNEFRGLALWIKQDNFVEAAKMPNSSNYPFLFKYNYFV